MPFKVILSAGGTGGHMFPALALAQALQAKRAQVLVVTDKRGERYVKNFGGVEYRVVESATVGAGVVGKIKMVLSLAVGIGQAMVLLMKYKPNVVVGFGGYPSFPAVVAGQVLRVPTVLHEQNAVLGKANKMLAGRATKIALSLATQDGLPEEWRKKTVVTGNPVRADFGKIASYIEPDMTGDFNILVLGGSQGAKVFSSLLPQAAALVPEKARLHIVQQCKAEDIEAVQAQYDAMGVRAQLEAFIDDVPFQMERAHLVVARSGASTVAEVANAGRPAIFIPYPHHADQQQRANAMALSAHGGAILAEEFDLTAEKLAKELEKLVQNPAILAQMADVSAKLALKEADLKLTKVVMSL